MKNKKFFDLGQASQYLRHTVIRVDKEPVYVYDVLAGRTRGEPFLLSYVPLSDIGEDSQTINLYDEKVDMNPVPLGMCVRYDGEHYHTYYVARTPARKWKVGLSLENLQIYGIGGKQITDRDTINRLFPTKLLSRTIRGRYASITSALSKLRDGSGAIPISRRFAISHDRAVYHKTTHGPVGFIEKGTPVLSQDYFYLKESLEEDLARS